MCGRLERAVADLQLDDILAGGLQALRRLATARTVKAVSACRDRAKWL
jgi:hypothetical protein